MDANARLSGLRGCSMTSSLSGDVTLVPSRVTFGPEAEITSGSLTMGGEG